MSRPRKTTFVMNRKGEAARAVARLKRRSDKQLLLSLSRKCTKLYRDRHYVGTIHAYKSIRRKVRHFAVDLAMLDTLGSALGQRPSVHNGVLILDEIWPRVGDRICRKLRICETFKPGDASLILAIWALLHRGQPITDRDVYLIVAVLVVRLGPNWMCQCSQREREAK
jgi:hypothetical protein